MIVRALDENGDWTFGKGRNNYKSGVLAVAQNIQTRLQSFLGDCFFDTAAGIDWFNLLGTKNQLQLKLAISSVILNTENVASIISLSLNLDPFTRNLLLTYKVQTYFGEIVAEDITIPDFITTEDGDILTTEDGDPLVT